MANHTPGIDYIVPPRSSQSRIDAMARDASSKQYTLTNPGRLQVAPDLWVEGPQMNGAIPGQTVWLSDQFVAAFPAGFFTLVVE